MASYIRAYVAALTWLYDPANSAEAQEILQRNVNVSPLLAARIYEIPIDPLHGFSRTAALDIEGIRTVLTLRSQYATPRKLLGDPKKYIVFDYYEHAVGTRMEEQSNG